jgi:DNA invertase Pin-like site-specific DNA recombinase
MSAAAMATNGKFVAYYRVSTQKQGRSGLGLAAQRQAVADYLNGGDWKIVGEFTEVESGKKSDRPELAKAFAMCRLHGAKLVIAKLDRLSRDAHFLLGLKNAGVDFVAADMPDANRLTVGIMAIIAEDEARRISERTKAALQAAKKRGVKLGGFRGAMPTARMRKLSAEALRARADAKAADLAPIIKELQAAGKTSLRAIAAGLNEAGIPTARGGEWSSAQVMRILERLDPFREEEAAAA